MTQVRLNVAMVAATVVLFLAAAFAIASPLLHHIWFALYEHRHNLAESFLAMAVGDFCGTVIVLYFAKRMLSLLPRRP